MPRVLLSLLLLAAGCSAASAAPAPAVRAPRPPAALPRDPRAVAGASAPPAAPGSDASGSRVPRSAPFACTEIIGLTITSEWFEAGFEELVDDARFQARTRPHTFVEQWADPAHPAWSQPLTSPCQVGQAAPERIVLVAANWTFTTREQWTTALEGVIATLEQRDRALRDVELYTVLRGPQNRSCGDPKSVVDPLIDDAIEAVARRHPDLVHAGPRLEAPDCSVFERGGPHFTAEGKKRVAALMARAL